MKNYYEILGVSIDASVKNIKKGYFEKIREFPPDRFPNKFMQIREAYEILSNERTRQEFDQMFEMPPAALQNIEFAKEAMELEEPEEAIRLLEKASFLYPDILLIQNLLGEAYLQNRNTGKAVKVFESLVDKEPKNATFAGNYAHACLSREWHRKAVKAYEKALDLDSDNYSLWVELSEAYLMSNRDKKAKEVLLIAIKNAEDKNWDQIDLIIRVITIDIGTYNIEEAKKYVKKVIELAFLQEDMKENVAFTLIGFAQILIKMSCFDEIEFMIKGALDLMPEDERILKHKHKLIKISKKISIFEKMQQDFNVDENILQLVGFNIFSDEYENIEMEFIDPLSPVEKKLAIYVIEFKIINNINKYHNNIIYIKNNYPEMYEINKEFFNDVLVPHKRKQLLKKYMEIREENELLMHMLLDAYEEDDDFDEWENDYYDDELEYDDYEPQKPFVHEKPKVGRNDPCPCGSGKKYKKCCGKL